MDSSKADAAVAKLEEQRAQDAEASRKKCAQSAYTSFAFAACQQLLQSPLYMACDHESCCTSLQQILQQIYMHAVQSLLTVRRAAELAKVVVSKEDVKVVANEFDIPVKAADTKLREHGGDLKATLRSLLNEGLPAEA